MKAIKAVIFSLLIIFSVVSCQREITIEPISPATGSLKNDSTGNCLGNTVSGNYRVATGLNSSNTISVQVNVTTTGSYRIFTDTLNGYSFSAEGVFTTTGLTTVVLNAKGTPLAAGNDNFTITYKTTACHVTVSVLPVTTNSGAVFTLGGAGGACTGATIQGTYKVGTPLSSTNTLTIQVNVATIGSYSLSTTPVNGITFPLPDLLQPQERKPLF